MVSVKMKEDGIEETGASRKSQRSGLSLNLGGQGKQEEKIILHILYVL